MPDPVSIKAVFDLPPERAIAFLDSKGYRVSVDWTDTFDAEHDASFTVAKIAKVDLLRAIHISLLEAQTNGTPYAAWLAQLKPTLAEAGWWGKVDPADNITGSDKVVNVTPRRLRTIYDTNLRMARSAALWQRVQASKATLPFLRYSAVLDKRTRPQHAAWHGVILPVDHPFWLTHFPPCGWNCRCTAIQVNEKMMAQRGWTVTDPAPPIVPVPFYNKSTRQTVQVPRGIDPGFGYNPGIARMQAVADKVAASLVQARREGLPIDDAALVELLSELVPARETTIDALARLRALIAAGEVAELAAAVLALMGVSLSTAAKKRSGHGRGQNDAWVTQPRQGHGRWGFRPGLETPRPVAAAPAFIAGPMPVDTIFRATGMRLVAGDARVSAKTHAKLKSGKHAEDYAVVRRHLPATLARPDYIAIDPNHPEKISFVKAVRGLSRGRTHMIVPVDLRRDSAGNYGVASGYGLNPNQLSDRVAKGWFRPVRE